MIFLVYTTYLRFHDFDLRLVTLFHGRCFVFELKLELVDLFIMHHLNFVKISFELTLQSYLLFSHGFYSLKDKKPVVRKYFRNGEHRFCKNKPFTFRADERSLSFQKIKD